MVALAFESQTDARLEKRSNGPEMLALPRAVCHEIHGDSHARRVFQSGCHGRTVFDVADPRTSVSVADRQVGNLLSSGRSANRMSRRRSDEITVAGRLNPCHHYWPI